MDRVGLERIGRESGFDVFNLSRCAGRVHGRMGLSPGGSARIGPTVLDQFACACR